MVFDRFIECRTKHLTFDGAAHVGDFFRSFADERNDDVNLRMVLGDARGYLLKENSFTCLGRCNDKCSLPLTNGCDHVDHSSSHLLWRGLKLDLLVRVDRGELVELRSL